MVVYKRVQTGEKPYKCDSCENNFAEKGKLTKHMLVQSGKKHF